MILTFLIQLTLHVVFNDLVRLFNIYTTSTMRSCTFHHTSSTSFWFNLFHSIYKFFKIFFSSFMEVYLTIQIVYIWAVQCKFLFVFSFLLDLLGWNCLIKLYRFQVHNSTTHHLYTILCLQIKSSSITIYPPIPSSTCPHSIPRHNHHTVICVDEFFAFFTFCSITPIQPLNPCLRQRSACSLSVSLSLFCLYILFIGFHIWVKSYGICLFLTGLFHLAYCSPGPSMLSQRVRFPSFH